MFRETGRIAARVGASHAIPGGATAAWPPTAIQARRWVMALLIVGTAWRAGRWALAMPLWRDEANLGLNVLRRSFGGLTTPLDYFQVAPLLFLWAEKAVMAVIGTGERAVRLLPTLASIGALLAFARLAVRRFAPLQATLAVGFLASSYYATRYGSELKPYSLDLFASVVILGLTLDWLDRPGAVWPPALLVIVTPLLVGVSYPSVFIGVGAALVLIARALRERRRLFLVFAGIFLGITATAFLLFYQLATGGQDRVTGPVMRSIWADAFPPTTPSRVLLWLLDVHTGNLVAYPIGGRYGGSTATFLLMVTGVLVLWRDRRAEALSLLLLPFGLNLLAASLHRYPYGDSARIAQHLAPAVCLLAGCGAAALLERVMTQANRGRAVTATLAALCLLGIVGLAIDIREPYKTRADLSARENVRSAFSRQPDHRVVVLSEPTDVRYLWYLETAPGTIVQDPPEISLGGDSLSLLVFSPDDDRLRRLENEVASRPSEWVKREDAEYRLPLDSADSVPPYCRSMWLIRRPQEGVL